MGSWIESFVKIGGGLETPEIYRRWAAITTIGAVLEQRVFVLTSRQLFPNIYTMLIGPPGVGKSIAIASAASLVRKLDGLYIGPISVTGASLIDALAAAKRVTHDKDGPLQFNSLFLMPDDLQALLHKYDNELVGNLTVFYDTTPYIQTRRVEALRVEITSPQLSILAGTTESHLLTLLPQGAWEQGFMSRVMMIYSADKPLKDDIFTRETPTEIEELVHDLNCIFALKGQLAVSDDFKLALNSWRKGGCLPLPDHPRLVHYNSRRVVHLLKLAIIACCDRSDGLKLEGEDFTRAKRWLVEAEGTMPGVFGGGSSPDHMAMKEILHVIGTGEVMETKLIRLVSQRVSAHMVKRVIELMTESKMLELSRVEKGQRFFKVGKV